VSAFAELGDLAPLRIWEGVVARVVQSDRLTLAVVELEPDCFIPEHSHENEQVGLLLTGSLEFRIGDETRQLGPGATWCIRANVPHDVRTGPDGAVVAEVFAPPRADWEGLEQLAAGAPRWPS
jgi:quercetin dioxygenase-like cupin family protein